MTLQTKWRSCINNYEEIQRKEHQLNEYIAQLEIDIDDEIENIKINYNNELKFLDEYAKRLTLAVCNKDCSIPEKNVGKNRSKIAF